MSKVLFVAGIDTGIGKTFATGLMARYLLARGCRVITQKIVQTGSDQAADILLHRRLMGVAPSDHDREGTTCPFIFDFPASPHLAAARAGRRVDAASIDRSTAALSSRFDHVLIEGVGGVCVPLDEEFTVLDYLEERGYPVVVVSSPRLGSINHTLLTLEALSARGLPVAGIVYNLFHREAAAIVEDTRALFTRALAGFGFAGAVVDLPPMMDPGAPPPVDFAPFFPEG